MLRIREQQLQAFEADILGRFYERLEAHIIEQYPEETAELSKEEIRRRVLVGLERASGWGFDPSGDEQNAFVSLMFAYAPNFDTQPNIHRALAKSRDTEDRWAEIFAQTTDADWEESEELCDPKAWWPDEVI